jgi:hypothetical protein
MGRDASRLRPRLAFRDVERWSPDGCWILAKGPPATVPPVRTKRRGQLRLAVFGRRVGMLTIALTILVGTGAVVLATHAPQAIGSLSLVIALIGIGQATRWLNARRARAIESGSKALTERQPKD